jgi:hypothetical protein
MGSARMLPGYMYCKPFTVNAGTCAGVYRWNLRRGHSFILGFHTTVFQAEVYAIKACIMENIEKDYRLEHLFLPTVRQPSKPWTVPDEFQISL